MCIISKRYTLPRKPKKKIKKKKKKTPQNKTPPPPKHARRQKTMKGGSTREASRYYGRGSGGRSRPPEALGYLVQNPAF